MSREYVAEQLGGLVDMAEHDLAEGRRRLEQALDAAGWLRSRLNPDTCSAEIGRLRTVEEAARRALQQL